MVDKEEKARRGISPPPSNETEEKDAVMETTVEESTCKEANGSGVNGTECDESCSSDEMESKNNVQEPVCKIKCASSDPNFGVVWSFLSKFGYLLNLPECSIDEMENEFDVNRKLEKETDKQGFLEKLHIKLLRRLSKSCDRSFSCLSQVSSERLERTLIKLAKALDLKLAWDLEQFGYHVLTKGEKLLLLKSLCELQFDENPNFRSHLNDEYVKNDNLQALRLQPFGKDIEGRMIWYHEDKQLCIRVYSVEDDDADSVSWKVHASNSDELNDWIQYLKLKSSVNPKDVAFHKRQEKKQEEKARRKAEEEEKRKKKKGRGRKPKAKPTKAEDTESSDDEDENPCARCFSNNRPELVLLCDKCDAAYHTLCLRPPLMVIPEGDWFCPFCQQEVLIEALATKLKELISKKKAAERASKRLDYCGIDLSNIVDHTESTDGTDGNRRSGRARKTIDYNFSQYDEVIHHAIVTAANKENTPKPRTNEAVSTKTFYGNSKPRERRVLSGKELIYGVDEDIESEESEVVQEKESDDESYRAAEDEDDFVNDAEEEEDEDEPGEDEDDESDFEDDLMGRNRRTTRRSAARNLQGRRTRRKSKRLRTNDDSDDDMTESDNSWEKFPRTSKRKRSSIKQNYAEFEYSFDEDSERDTKKKKLSIEKFKKTSEDEEYNPKRGKQLWSDEEEEEEDEEAADAEMRREVDDVLDELKGRESESEASMKSSSDEEDNVIKRDKRSLKSKRNVLEDSEDSTDSDDEKDPGTKSTPTDDKQSLVEDKVAAEDHVKSKNEDTTAEGETVSAAEIASEDQVASDVDSISKEANDNAEVDSKDQMLANGEKSHDVVSQNSLLPTKTESKTLTDKEQMVTGVEVKVIESNESNKDSHLERSTETSLKQEAVKETSTSEDEGMDSDEDEKAKKEEIIVKHKLSKAIRKHSPESGGTREGPRDFMYRHHLELNLEDRHKQSVGINADEKINDNEKKAVILNTFNGEYLTSRKTSDLTRPRVPSSFYNYRQGRGFHGESLSPDLKPFSAARQPLHGVRTPPCNTNFSTSSTLYKPMFPGDFPIDTIPGSPRSYSAHREKLGPRAVTKGSPREHFPVSPEQCHPFYPRYPRPLPPFGPVLPYPGYPTQPGSRGRSAGCTSFPLSPRGLSFHGEVGTLPPPPQLLHFPSGSANLGEPPYTEAHRNRGERPIFRPVVSLGAVSRHSGLHTGTASPPKEGHFAEMAKNFTSAPFRGVMPTPSSPLPANASPVSKTVSSVSNSMAEKEVEQNSKRAEATKRPRIWSPYAESQPSKAKEKSKEDPLKETSIVKNYTAFQSMVINPVSSSGKVSKSH